MNLHGPFHKKNSSNSFNYGVPSRVQLPPAHQNSPSMAPEPFDEVLRARKVKALRAFLCKWFCGMMYQASATIDARLVFPM